MLAENQYKGLHQIWWTREDLSQKKVGLWKGGGAGPGRPPPPGSAPERPIRIPRMRYLDNLDTWQHESTWAHFLDEPKGVIRGVFLKGEGNFSLDKYLLFNHDYIFSEFFYVFSQVHVSKY